MNGPNRGDVGRLFWAKTEHRVVVRQPRVVRRTPWR
jgi:hypothetical protein